MRGGVQAPERGRDPTQMLAAGRLLCVKLCRNSYWRHVLSNGVEKEQIVLSTIGDGSDDQQAAEKLGLSYRTVDTHRKTIMGELGLHHKGRIMCYALQQGYVPITPQSVFRAELQRQIQSLTAAKKSTASRLE